MGLALTFVTYSYLWQMLLARGVVWPSVVPGFHFLRYFNAGESMLAAYGVVAVGSGLAAVAERFRPAIQWGAAPALRRILPILLTAVLAALSYPAYAARIDLTTYRQQAQQMYLGPDDTELFRWVRNRLGPTDVVAAPETLALGLVGPAGRKVLVVDRFFSNPYVSWQARRAALDLILESLERGNCEGFKNVADEYRVTHLLARRGAVRPEVAEACGLVPVFEGRAWTVHRRQR
jgi:hypothetical protein